MPSKVASQLAMPPVLSLSQFRRRRLVSLVKPSWLISVSAKVATLLKLFAFGQKGVADTAVAVAGMAAHFAYVSLPMIVVWADRLELLAPAMAAVHLGRSALCIYCAANPGYSQFAEGFDGLKRALALHVELIAELCFGFQDQMSLPLMAVLHALRQVAWMLILVWRMDATPVHGILRGVCNWVVMMMVSWFWEMRTHAAYKRQRQQQLPALPHLVAARPASEQFVSHLPSADKPPAQVGSSAKQASRMSSCPCPSTSQHLAQPEAGPTSDQLVCVLSDCVPSYPERMATVMPGGTDQGGRPGNTPSKAVMQHKQDVSPTHQGGSSAHSGSLQPAMLRATEARPSSELDHPFKTLSHAMGQQRKQPYVRNRGRMVTTICVKLDGIELDQMPAELPRLMHEQLRHCMPGVTMTGLALRSGCVMMTLDLASGEGDGGLVDTALAASVTDLFNRLMQGHAMGQVLEDGATMRIQAAGELAFCRWDSSTRSYTSDSSAGVPAQELGLASCRMPSAMPAVFCLPTAGPAGGQASYQLSLTVQLQLPGTFQLHGWQPGGVQAPSQSQLLQDGPVVDAMLLARQLDGGYLPVELERLSSGGASNDDATTRTITAQVTLAMDGTVPGGVRLELWCKAKLPTDSANGSSTRANDLLIAYMPLLVLPGNCKEAVAELEQHIKDLGGVQPWHAVPALASSTVLEAASNTSATAICDLLEDLGGWLAHHSQAAAHSNAAEPAAAPDCDMSQLGNDLLVYAVQHGLEAVAGQIVNVMQRGEQQITQTGRSAAGGDAGTGGVTIGPSAWLVLAAHGSAGAGDSTTMSLLHAAMASGNPDILAQVLRWGILNGGPDWAWPWELEDAAGCTALHLAAAQRVAGACAALLKTITCMLPAAQVQAARNAWLHCQGAFGTVPAELASDSGNTVGPDWLDIDQDPSSSATVHRRAAGNCTPLLHAIEFPPPGPSTAGASIIHQAETTQMPLQLSATAQSWLSSMVEVWTTRETDEYHAWAKKQISGVVSSWAAAMVFLAVFACYQSLMAGCKLQDLSDMFLHTVAHIPLAAATRGCSWLGDWQSWMVTVHVCHIMAILLKLNIPELRATMLVAGMASGADIVYVLVLTAVLDQTPLHTLLVARAVEAFCHGLVYKAAHVFPSPFRRALIVHGLALLVTTTARARQVRAYRRWQAAQESQMSQALHRKSKNE